MAYSYVDLEKFWSLVEIRGENECWPWRGYVDNYGVGKFYAHGLIFPVGRFVYTVRYGRLEGGRNVKHICGDKNCCNPAHLRLADSYSAQWRRRRKEK